MLFAKVLVIILFTILKVVETEIQVSWFIFLRSSIFQDSCHIFRLHLISRTIFEALSLYRPKTPWTWILFISHSVFS